MVKLIYLIVTNISYPFGGGEDFLEQTMEWCSALGFQCYWISFKHVKNGDFKEFEIIKNRNGIMVHIPGGFNEKNLYYWIKLFNPTIIHTQGPNREEIVKVSSQHRIPILAGYHFWNGLIDLNPATFNKDIELYSSKHKRAPIVNDILSNKFAFPYVCSQFMQKITKDVCNIEIPVVYASSSKIKCLSGSIKSPVEVGKVLKVKGRRFITQINIHKLKGGEIFYNLAQNFKMPLIAIQSEPCSEDLDCKIFNLLAKRKNSVYFNHLTDLRCIYSVTKILLVPSLVDETFCRVVNEGLMNGIPIITTGAGNIKYLVGDAAIIIPHDNQELWNEHVYKLYYNKELWEEYSKKSLIQYNLFSEQIAASQFEILIKSSKIVSKDRNLMILVPFCDQGLGIQGRNYADILSSNFNVFIFSYLPYNASNIKELQIDSNEWTKNNYKVYYSPNIREKITNEEIVNFVSVNNIGKCIIPETCWFRIFEIAKLLKCIGVKTYAIPNIEIVRKDEIYKHRFFEKILCNNTICENNFKKFGFNNIENIGYSVTSNFNIQSSHIDERWFLCVGGMNAFSRKQVQSVCKAFYNAYQQLENKNIKLVVTVQKFYEKDLDQYKIPGCITIIDNYLTYKDLANLYEVSDVIIQVSKKEGLGLGFFESISKGIPVLTLDTAPHNELIIEGINGWLSECLHSPMIDNPESLMQDAIVLEDKLTSKFLEIANMDDIELEEMKCSTIKDYEERFSTEDFRRRMVNALL